MSLPSPPIRPLAPLKHALRVCRAQRHQQRRTYAEAAELTTTTPSLPPKYPSPSPHFRPSQATKQNRLNPTLKTIKVHPPPRSTLKTCPDPIAVVTASQLPTLDPTGARTRLFSPTNPDRAQPGDILLVRQRNSEPFAGICLAIRQRHQPIDTAILLRNTLTRVGVEMWFKVYSPNVEGVEIVRRKEKRARRAKLYYMRQARHDVGSLEGVVRGYLRQKAGGPQGKDRKGRDGDSGRKKKKGKK